MKYLILSRIERRVGEILRFHGFLDHLSGQRVDVHRLHTSRSEVASVQLRREMRPHVLVGQLVVFARDPKVDILLTVLSAEKLLKQKTIALHSAKP